MTTPHEGRAGLWQQGSQAEAVAWLANLRPEQQLALQRTIRTFEAAGPMFNAAARVREIIARTAARAAELGRRAAAGATDLGRRTAAGAAELGRRTAEVGRQTAAGAAELGRQTVAGATELGRRTADGTAAAAEWTAAAAAGVGHRTADKATEVRQRTTAAAAGVGDRVAGAARQVAGNVSRWWQQKQGAATARAAAVRAAFQAARQDPEVLRAIRQSGISPQELLEMNQQFARAIFHPDREQAGQALERAAQLAAEVRNPNTNQGPQAGQQPTGGDRAQTGSQAPMDPARVLSGSPAASQAIAQRPDGQSSSNRPGTGRHRQGPEQGR